MFAGLYIRFEKLRQHGPYSFVISVTSHINCIAAGCYFYEHGLAHGVCHYQVMMTLHFLNDVANDTESTTKIKKILQNR